MCVLYKILHINAAISVNTPDRGGGVGGGGCYDPISCITL